MHGEDRTVDAGRLGGTQERPDILGILERIERQDKGCLATVGRSGEDLLRGRVTSRRDDQSDALVSIKPGQRRQRPALHLDDWNSEVGRVQDKLLEGLSPLGHHEQPECLAVGDEGFLNWPPAGDQLLVLSEQLAQIGAGRDERLGHAQIRAARPTRLESTRCSLPGEPAWDSLPRERSRRAVSPEAARRSLLAVPPWDAVRLRAVERSLVREAARRAIGREPSRCPIRV